MKTFFQKGFIALLGFIVCGIPAWIFLGVRALVAPQGFWQEMVLGTLGVWVLGGLQVVGIVIFLFLLLFLLTHD